MRLTLASIRLGSVGPAAGEWAALCAESVPFSSKAVIVIVTGFGEAASRDGKSSRFETFKPRAGG
ncbi:hypothetical protein ACFQU1_18630 [Chelatococcus sp. GCM10030263]|uniref:hypothetical protein n=1 Tax=Chelatococcus sp. GCM10030263 TaxID=3273387 RepID=UPI003609D33A